MADLAGLNDLLARTRASREKQEARLAGLPADGRG
jgi:hypothetical protein